MCLKSCVHTFFKSDENSNKFGYSMMTMCNPIGHIFLMTALHPKVPEDFAILPTVQTLHHVTSG